MTSILSPPLLTLQASTYALAAMAGVYPGPYALQALLIKTMGMVDVVGLERVQTTAAGDYAVTILSFKFADPSLKPAELCDLFRFRGGNCCKIKPYYFDAAIFNAAFAAKAAKG